ncbi:hypothetical protein ACH47X_06560 [Promicromonospora kroppenstedtii]|uniref:Peptidase inhibitor family I36 n=1 Tax=Promicromonospora kroppenstedtii TaxID=440482 RepID=A0ABW7XGC5_9MICO
MLALLLAGTAGTSTIARAETGLPEPTARTAQQLSADDMAAARTIAVQPDRFAPLVGGPWSNPAPARFYTNQPDTVPACGVGYACMKIKAGSQSWYTDFWYYDYGVYALENWIGAGWLNNRQTGGATLRTYTESGTVIKCYPSNSNGAVSRPNWSPVYYISLLPQRC